MPLLEERHAGEPAADLHERYGLASLLEEIGATSPDTVAEAAGQPGQEP
jgi:hypothetical protein